MREKNINAFFIFIMVVLNISAQQNNEFGLNYNGYTTSNFSEDIEGNVRFTNFNIYATIVQKLKNPKVF